MKPTSPIVANLVHLSYNMWEEHDSPVDKVRKESRQLRFDEKLWDDMLAEMVKAGFNMVVFDLGDAIQYQSHPEIAVEGAWSPERLRQEMYRLREMGLEMIPKLNFSTAHDAWLGEYSRCVSTPRYYQVCRDLIEEVVEIMEKPRLFHLGMDEETAAHQKAYNYMVVRQNDLFWNDFKFYLDEVRRHGVRPWIWSDVIWNHREEFLKRIPTDVLQSNWYYATDFEHERAKAYDILGENGYEQVLTCSNYNYPENARLTVEYAKQTRLPKVSGYLQTPWYPTTEAFREHHMAAIRLLGDAVRES